jgi:hydroxypyruvate isomerase
MPRFCANLGLLWPQLPLLERMRAAARAGFAAVEMHWPYDVPALEVGACARELGLTLLGINTAPGDVARGERGLGALRGREADFQAAMEQSIEYCKASGACAIHAMAGNVIAEDHAKARAVFAGNLRECAPKAAAAGLTVLLEPLNPRDNPGYFYSRVEQAVELIEELALPNVKLQFDVYHVAVTQGDVLTRLARHMPVIGHVQIAAVPSRAEPDEGEIAYPAIFAALDRLGYSGWVAAEYKPRAATDEGLGWLTAMGAAH